MTRVHGGVRFVLMEPDSAADTLPSGTQLDHFSLVRMIGKGGMGEVYLARDTRLGRKVALKLIAPSLLGNAAAVDDFLSEAKTTATFSHPHIVGIYFVGEFRGAPYIALEYVEGQNLRERLEQSPPSVAEAIRIALAVAEGLGEAHRHGVLHLDLKPENVIVGKDGRLRVLDFGMSRLLNADPQAAKVTEWAPQASSPPQGAVTLEGQVRGTPPYMAPEQWLAERLTGATDVWALGVLLYELLVGEHPFSHEIARLATEVTSPELSPNVSLKRDVPEALAALVAQCLAKVPSARPSAADLVIHLGALLGHGPARTSDTQSPFRGLLAFTERHADFFFGRDAEVEAFLEALRETSVLPVVGLSGAGKSSFVQAGVIPRLREQSPYLVISIRPGSDPFLTLAQRLSGNESQTVVHSLLTSSQQGQLGSLDEDGGQDLAHDRVQALAERLRAAPSLLALELLELAEQRKRKVLLFVDQLEEIVTLVSQESVQRAFLEALCSAADDVKGPVRVIFTVRDDFLSRLAGGASLRAALSRVTVLRSPGPEVLREILTKPLAQTGYRFESPALVEEMVAAVQGESAALPLVQFALGMLWESRDKEQRILTRTAYQRIGGVVGALAAHADAVLAGLSDSELGLAREILLRLVTADGTRRVVLAKQALEGLSSEAAGLLARLTDSRLVTIRRSQNDGEAKLELAHESLINSWDRLKRWVDGARDEIVMLADLDQAIERWHKHGRRADELLSGQALSDAQRFAGRHAARVTERVREFLEASGKLSEEIGERAARQHAETQAQAGGAAWSRGDVLEARAFMRASLETHDSTIGRALWWQIGKNPLVWRARFSSVISRAVYHSDGKHVVVACGDQFVYLVNRATTARRALKGQNAYPTSLAVSAAGMIACGSFSARVVLWNPAHEATFLHGAKGFVYGLAFHPHQALLAGCDSDGNLLVWRFDDPQPVRSVRLSVSLVAAAVSPDGSAIAVGGSDGKVRLFDWSTLQETRVFSGHEEPIGVGGLAFAGDGRWLASGSEDKTVRVWSMHDGACLHVLRGHSRHILGLSAAATGSLLASSSADGVRVWDADGGTELRVLDGHSDVVRAVAMAPDGHSVLSGSMDQTAGYWDLDTAATVAASMNHDQFVSGVVFSPDAQRLFTCGGDHNILDWDVVRGIGERKLRGHTAFIESMIENKSGAELVSGAWDGTVRVWNIARGSERRVLGGGELPRCFVVAYLPGERRIVAGYDSGAVRVWNLDDGAEERVLQAHGKQIRCLTVSPTGRLYTSSWEEPDIKEWDIASGTLLRVLISDPSPPTALAITPDGARLVSGHRDGAVRLWQLADGSHTLLGRHAEMVSAKCEIDRGGSMLVTVSGDQTARLWNLDDGTSTTLSGHVNDVNAGAFSRDGRLVATVGDDATVRIWNRNGRPYWRAPLMLPALRQVFTHRGWQGFDGVLEAPAPAAWRDVVATDGLRGAVSGTLLYLTTHAGTVEVWDMAADRRLATHAWTGVRTLVPSARGIVLLAEDSAWALEHAQAKLLTTGVSAVASDGDMILMAAGDTVQICDEHGVVQKKILIDSGATALARAHEWIAVGYENGSLQLFGENAERQRFEFAKTQGGRVLRICAGPMRTLIAGYQNGAFAIWSLDSGAQLHLQKLNGAVVHLAIEGETLLVASELGDVLALDLSAFASSYAQLMAQVWAKVPVTIEDGFVVSREAQKPS